MVNGEGCEVLHCCCSSADTGNDCLSSKVSGDVILDAKPDAKRAVIARSFRIQVDYVQIQVLLNY